MTNAWIDRSPPHEPRQAPEWASVAEVAAARTQEPGPLQEVPAVRQGLIDQVRAQIEAGAYDSAEKPDAALDGLLEDLDVMP